MRIKNVFKYLKIFTLNKFTQNKIPYSAQIELTLRCNAVCPFCSFPLLPKNLISKEMTTQQIKNIIDQIAKLGVTSLSFTGGEPTLRKDLPDLVYHAGIVHDFMNGVATNGYLMPSLLKQNGRLEGLDYILLSLDYPTAALHDKMRGIKVFHKVLETIELANKRDKKVIISTVVMKDNIHLLDSICELAERYNCSIELFPCEDIIRDFPEKTYQIKEIDSLIPNISVWANLMLKLRDKYKNILTDPISIAVVERGGFGGYPNYYQNLLRCHVAEAYLFVRYDGYIDYPCKIHPFKSFDGLKHSISKIYNSKEVRDIMVNHDRYDFCTNCRLGCAIASSMPARWKTLGSKFILGYLNGNLK
ncbi:MAG: radical SAM protein [Candidatus Lokiarchaeota archaeon]|nr:radical SAM protein [Candidatus Lokiarchaeota archaeon]